MIYLTNEKTMLHNNKLINQLIIMRIQKTHLKSFNIKHDIKIQL